LEAAASGGGGLVRLCPAIAFWSLGEPRTPFHTGGYGDRADGTGAADRGGNSTAGCRGPLGGVRRTLYLRRRGSGPHCLLPALARALQPADGGTGGRGGGGL